MERHTVEYTFDGEKLSSGAGEYTDLTLYRTDEGGYFVHVDARKSGDNSVLETGESPRGFSEHDILVMWPELLEAQSRRLCAYRAGAMRPPKARTVSGRKRRNSGHRPQIVRNNE